MNDRALTFDAYALAVVALSTVGGAACFLLALVTQ